MGAFKLENGELNVKSVVAIIVATGGVIIGFYTQIAIPIRDIQSRLTAIQVQMADQQDEHKAISVEQKEQNQRLDRLEQAIKK